MLTFATVVTTTLRLILNKKEDQCPKQIPKKEHPKWKVEEGGDRIWKGLLVTRTEVQVKLQLRKISLKEKRSPL